MNQFASLEKGARGDVYKRQCQIHTRFYFLINIFNGSKRKSILYAYRSPKTDTITILPDDSL